MSKELPSGTPSAPTGYLQPPDRSRTLRWTFGAGALLVVVFAVLFAVKQRQFVSPGAVAAAHSAIDSRCVQCHNVGHAVEDLRCNRCHDAAGSDRLAHSAHVLLGSRDVVKAAQAPTVTCVVCHTEHRGARVLARAVDDRQCGECHTFSAFKGHPEFAAVRAQIATGIGINFGHQRHLEEVQKAGGRRCEACHEPTSDVTGFQAIKFDTHCASCHAKDGFVEGATEALSRQYLPGAQPETGEKCVGQPCVRPSGPARLQLVTVSRLKHRDPWVLAYAQRLRRMIDPDGETAELVAVQARIAYLNAQLQAGSFAAASPDDLTRWQTALEQAIASYGAASSRPADPTADARALKDTADAVVQLAKAIGVADTTAAAAIVDLAPPVLSPPAGGVAESSDSRARSVDARKRELLSLLDAISQRGGKSLADRATALRDRVNKLTAASGQATADAAALLQTLSRLDEAFRAIRTVPDPEALYDAAQVAQLRSVVQRQVSGALSVDDFEERRRELVSLLKAIGSSTDASVRNRAALLRDRVLMLVPGRVDLSDTLARLKKSLERVKLELELLAAKESVALNPAAAPRDRQAVQSLIAMLSQQQTALATGPRPSVADSPEERERASSALTTLLGPCLKCHKMDGARLARVSAAQTVFRQATFTHKPHVQQEDCLKCHAPATTSTKATDLIVPGVVRCQECHTPSKARSDCAACHVYHPSSTAALVDLP